MIIYQGKSNLDGAPIVVIATENSKNVKTGSMVQTWIMRSDIAPHIAVKTGDDISVCGNCPHRPANAGSCYVKTFQAPRSVYAKYKRGGYDRIEPDKLSAWFAGSNFRIGSYGDPAAVPVEIWESCTANAKTITGYTHQWRDHPELLEMCMASCDTLADYREAKASGWRTFRVRTETDPLEVLERVCPASHEAGQKITCDQCGACNGNKTDRFADIAIVAHGATAKRFNNI